MATGRQTQKKGQANSTTPPKTSLMGSRPFAEPPQLDSSPTPEIQTKVESGQAPSNLSRLNLSASPPIQPKLTIGAPGDPYEQEADAIARQVVKQMSAPIPSDGQGESIQQQTSKPSISRLTVQRQGAIEGGTASSELENTINQAKGGGSPLAEPIRRKMEGAIGADFSGVRVHTNSTADTLNRSIQAKAFTTGKDIFFRQGAYQPTNNSGQELIAHELIHTIQQNSSSTNLDRKPMWVQRDEQEGEYQNPSRQPMLNPSVYLQIIDWLKGKAQRQNKEILFEQYFSNQPQGVQMRTILRILMPLVEMIKLLDSSTTLARRKYIIDEFNSDVKSQFKGFSLKGDAIDWDQFSEMVRQEGGGFSAFDSENISEQVKNAAKASSGLIIFDENAEEEDQVKGSATLAKYVLQAEHKMASAIDSSVAKQTSTAMGIVTAGIDAGISGYSAYQNTSKADKARELQDTDDQMIALGARVHKRNQLQDRTGNIVKVAQGAGTIAATALGYGSAALTIGVMSFPIITVVGVATVAGLLIYNYFKTAKNQEKFADQLFQIQEEKDDKKRAKLRDQYLQTNGYSSVSYLYKDFVKLLSLDVYQRGVLGDDQEAVALIGSLKLTIDRNKKPPQPTADKIASKYGL